MCSVLIYYLHFSSSFSCCVRLNSCQCCFHLCLLCSPPSRVFADWLPASPFHVRTWKCRDLSSLSLKVFHRYWEGPNISAKLRHISSFFKYRRQDGCTHRHRDLVLSLFVLCLAVCVCVVTRPHNILLGKQHLQPARSPSDGTTQQVGRYNWASLLPRLSVDYHPHTKAAHREKAKASLPVLRAGAATEAAAQTTASFFSAKQDPLPRRWMYWSCRLQWMTSWRTVAFCSSHSLIPDTANELAGYTPHLDDRSRDSSKSRGGEVMCLCQQQLVYQH